MNSYTVLWPGPRHCGENALTLKMNECCLGIFSESNFTRQLYTRSSECERCNFTLQKSEIIPNQVTSFILNTDYPLEFYIEEGINKVCQKLYPFGDMGRYLMNVSQSSCSEIEVKDMPESLWLNFGVLFSVFLILVVAYGLYKCVVTTRCLRTVRSQISFQELEADLGNPDARDPNGLYMQARARRRSRVAALDVFRGLTIALMIFVNYGGGGYSFFKHSPWDGLTIADIVFPWFIWSMGVSIALSLRSRLRTSVSRRKILGKIIRRSLVLIALGLILNSGVKNNQMKNSDTFSSLRIFGVLQRIGVTYFIVATIELLFMKPQRNEQFGPWSMWADITDSILQWIFALLLVAAHELITFMLPVPGCPKGYLGPGGWHEYSKYENCTGGAAGYIDRLIFKNSHLYQHPTCKTIYHTHLPYDPEGLLGTLTCVFCAFLGVHAGRIILSYENTFSRARRWLIWGIGLGLIGGFLCNFVKNDGIIPINKNLWSISYVLITSAMAFIIFSLLYWIIDYRRIYVGYAFLHAGMNALALYIGHDLFKHYLPWYWKPITGTHGELLAMNITATIMWLGVAYLLYRRNIFIVL